VIGAIIGEFIIGSGNSQGGLGVQIIFAQGRMYTALLFAEVICATLLGFVFFSAVSLLGHFLLRNWHESAADDLGPHLRSMRAQLACVSKDGQGRGLCLSRSFETPWPCRPRLLRTRGGTNSRLTMSDSIPVAA